MEEQQDQNQRLVSQSESIIYNEETTSKKKTIMQMLDIFAFLPVPKTNTISTKRSVFGSFLLIGIFFAYIIYSIVEFFVMNYPRMNQYSIPLDNSKVPMVDFAYGFVDGQNLDHTYYNPRFFTFGFQMVTKTADVDKKTTYPFSPEECGDLDWIGKPYTDNGKNTPFRLWCPDAKNQTDYYMQGLLLTSPTQVYPRITTNYCNNVTSLLFCDTYTNLLRKTGGGRLYLFTKAPKSTNWATGKTTTDKSNFNLNYYFLVPGDYNRAELVMDLTINNKMPDWLTSFSVDQTNTTDIGSQNFYVSDTTYYDPFSAFQIWMRLEDSITNIDIVYDTIIDKVSQWGALWGVLFSAFAIYFLSYNTEKFYKKNQEWANFDQTLQQLPNSSSQQQ